MFKRKSYPAHLQWIGILMCFLLLLMNVYRLFFFYHYNSTQRPFSGSAFILGLRYDLRMVAVLGLIMILLTSVPFFSAMKSKRSALIWTIINSVVFLCFLVIYGCDYYHYDYLHQRLNASVLNFLADATISGTMVWETYPVLSVGFFFLVLLFFFFKSHHRLLITFQKNHQTTLTGKGKAIVYFFAILLLSGFVFGKVDQYPLRWSDAFLFSDEYKANTALNPFQSFFSTLQFKDSKYDLAKVKKGYSMLSDYLGVDQPDENKLNFERAFRYAPTSNAKPNIVLVICESFSASKSSMFGNKLDPTPYFKQMCEHGVFFERCFTPAFGTARGVWATLTGIPDVQQPKTASRNPFAVDQHIIMNQFDGYDKFYFLGGSTTWANIRGVLKNNINSLQIIEQDHFKSDRADVWGISDKNLFLESNKILSRNNKPFFAIIQTADNHRPYTIPEEDLKLFKKVSYPQDTLHKYGFDNNEQLNAFRYADFNFSQFIEAAKKETYFNNTIFVFVGDHGLRGNAGEMFPKSFTQKGIMAEHVPLLFYAPNLLKSERIRKVCSQLDIMPSVASLAKVSHNNSALGVNLFDSNRHKRYAFIADPEWTTVGLVSDSFYSVFDMKTKQHDFVSVVDDNPVKTNTYTDSIRRNMETLGEAWYETAKYLLLNNKKKSPIHNDN